MYQKIERRWIFTGIDGTNLSASFRACAFRNGVEDKSLPVCVTPSQKSYSVENLLQTRRDGTYNQVFGFGAALVDTALEAFCQAGLLDRDRLPKPDKSAYLPHHCNALPTCGNSAPSTANPC